MFAQGRILDWEGNKYSSWSKSYFSQNIHLMGNDHSLEKKSGSFHKPNKQRRVLPFRSTKNSFLSIQFDHLTLNFMNAQSQNKFNYTAKDQRQQEINKTLKKKY